MNPERGEIHIGDRNIAFTVSRSRKRRCTIGFVMKDPHVVNVMAPMRASFSSIQSIMQKNTRWIVRRLAEFERAAEYAPKRSYAEGESVVYLGHAYRLVVTHDKNQSQGCILQPNKMIVNLHNEETDLNKQCDKSSLPLAGRAREGGERPGSFFILKHRTKRNSPLPNPPREGEGVTVLNEDVRLEILLFLKRRAKAKFQKRMDIWAKRMGVRYQKLVVANAAQRWGSCSPQNVVRLNWRLIMAPLAILDYVVVHELAHVRHKNHGAHFWAQVASHVPDWKTKRKHLHSIGRNLTL